MSGPVGGVYVKLSYLI